MKFPRIYSLKEIANLTQSEMIGDPQFEVQGINEIHMVEPGDLTFVDHPKYYDKALNSKATIILINKRVDCPQGKVLLINDDPFKAYVGLAKHFRPFVPCAKFISDTAEIGAGTVIQPGAFIGNNVKIGTNCIIHANVSIYDHTVIGNNVIIQSGSVIGADAYYYQKRQDGYHKMESCGRVVLHDNVEIGCNCTIDKGVSGDTVIGQGTKTDNHIQIGHDTVIGQRCLIGNASMIAGVTVIEDDVIIWSQVAIQKDLVIGKGAIILACSGVSKNLEGGKTYFGIPAIEARAKWKEIAYLRRLPELFSK